MLPIVVVKYTCSNVHVNWHTLVKPPELVSLSTIRNNVTSSPVAAHFSKVKHNTSTLRYVGTEVLNKSLYIHEEGKI